MRFTDRAKFVKKGIFGLKIYDITCPNGRGELRKFEDGSEGRLIKELAIKNVITLQASKLIAQHMFEGAAPAVNGVTHLAVGTGNPGWPVTPTPPAVESSTTLVAEIFRKAVTAGYIDGAGLPTVTRTGTVDFSCTFLAPEGNGAWRECGLFGGTGASATNGGDMFNDLQFDAITKSPALVLTAVWRIIF